MLLRSTRFLKYIVVSVFFAFGMVAGFCWTTVNGISISTVQYGQGSPQLVSDGAGGTIICFSVGNGNDSDIYAQRVNSSGSTLWLLNGVAICSALGDQISCQIVTDGSGGAIIAWQDNRSTHSGVYAQRVNSSGSTLWTVNGVTVSTSTVNVSAPGLLSDGSGGAFVIWADNRSGNSLIYAQRLNSSGSLLWTLNGVAIASTGSGSQGEPVLVSDGNSGIIVAYQLSGLGTSRLFAMRVNSNGSTLWSAPTCLDFNGYNNDKPTIVSDGSGGAIVAWQDTRLKGVRNDIYAQRVDSNGNTLWTGDGIVVCTTLTDEMVPEAISETGGGAIITWQDYRNTTSNINNGADIYAQRVDGSGNPVWTLNGVAVCNAINDQINQQITSDSSGGAYITWQDYRSTTASPSEGADIYVQEINNVGTIIFATDGKSYCNASSDQINPQIISNESGGAILTWTDNRNNTFGDIYAQSFYSNGLIPVELSIFEAVEDSKL